MAVVVNAQAADKNSEFAKKLVNARSKQIVNELVSGGLEPRRLEARGVLVDAPLLVDPADNPGRYNQAVELLPLDR